MQSLSDSFLSFLNVLLQWVTIGGMVLGLAAAIGLFFVSNETARRQERKLTDAKDRIVSIQERAKPRQITAQQKAEMVAILKDSPKGRISIMYPADDSEAYALSQQIADVLREAQWDVRGPTIVTLLGSGPPLMGVKLFVQDKDDDSIWLEPLCKALVAGCLSPRWRVNSNLKRGNAEIYVGPKPAD